jgi:hypothetical protein
LTGIAAAKLNRAALNLKLNFGEMIELENKSLFLADNYNHYA